MKFVRLSILLLFFGVTIFWGPDTHAQGALYDLFDNLQFDVEAWDAARGRDDPGVLSLIGTRRRH